MKVKDIIGETKNAAFSFEIVPPTRGRSLRHFVEIVERLMPANPKWIDVTAHASNVHFKENGEGSFRKFTFKKRPGTLGICGVIQNRFQVDTVAHLLCLGFTREETEDALIELNYLGAENVFLVRGDNPNYEKKYPNEKSFNNYAIDLVKQVVDLRHGRFLNEMSEPFEFDFCCGVAAYPEKHFEAANFDVDLHHLKNKVDAGADYIVTQMFFDNQSFYDFVARARKMGIGVPIVPGLKTIKSAAQLKSIPSTFHIALPSQLVNEIQASPNHCAEIGERWTKNQVQDLLSKGHLNIHFYVMNDSSNVIQVIKSLGYL